jgi:hypothetical protein
VAESFDSLILTALTRASAEPGGVPLVTSKTLPGLFPATAAGRSAAKRAIDDGLFVIAREEKGREQATITTKGLEKLLAESNPKPVLDDFVRVLEARETQVNELIATARAMTEQLAAMKRVVEAVLPKVTAMRVSEPNPQTPFPQGKGASYSPSLEGRGRGLGDSLRNSILTILDSWSATAGEDCPLPVLFRDLIHPTTIGEFHDCLRELHAAGDIYLHPWTGPLYALPEPTLSLLVGHEVAYYASLKVNRISPQRTQSALSHSF